MSSSYRAKQKRLERNVQILSKAFAHNKARDPRRFYYVILLDLCEEVSAPRLRRAIAYAEQRIAEDQGMIAERTAAK